MKILFLLPFLNLGGMERKAVLLARELSERGHEVDVAQFVGGGKLEPAMQEACSRLITIDWGAYRPPRRIRVPGLHRLRRGIRLRRILRDGQYDVVYGFGYEQNVYVATATLGCDAGVVWGIEGVPQSQGTVGRFLERRTLRFADLIITVSNGTRNHCLACGFPADRTIVIDNGIDTEAFRIDAVGREDARIELGIGHDTTLVGMLTRIDPVKNIEGFLEAAADVARSGPGVRPLIVGPAASTMYLESLKRLAARLGIADRIIWLGSRPDPARYLNAFDVYVSSSHTEGVSLSLLEAMACGRVCVVTDVGDSARVLGDMGIVVPPENAAALAAAIEQAIATDLRRRPEAIRKRVLDHFSASIQGTRTEAALLAMVADRDGV